MAEITNDRTGPGFLGIRIDIQRVEPAQGMIGRGAVGMNSDLKLVWAFVGFAVGEVEIFGQEVLLHSTSIVEWAESVEAWRNHPDRAALQFPGDCPELIILARQYGTGAGAKYMRKDASCTLLVAVDTGIAAGESGVDGSGPAMYLELDYVQLRRFARDLKAETEWALRLDEPDSAPE